MHKGLLLDFFKFNRFMRRRRRLTSKPVPLHRLNIYILPTRAGLFFAIVLLLMLTGAINYNNSLAFLLTFLLTSVSLLGIFYTYRNLWRLKFFPADVRPVFCGETLAIPLKIENYGEPYRYALKFYFNKKETRQAEVFDLPDRRVQTIVLHRLAQQRGRHDLCRIIVSSSYPLGLFRAWAFLNFKNPVLIYPRLRGDRRLPTPVPSSANVFGDQGSGVDDFIGLRTYHPGDPMGHIHWKALAKDQTLLTKQFGGECQTELWLDWVQLPHLDLEGRLSQLALWVVEAQKAGISYGLRLPDLEIPPACSERHRHQCLTVLAEFGQHADI